MLKLERLGGMHAFKLAIALLLIGYQSGVSAASVFSVTHVASYDVDGNVLEEIYQDFSTSPPTAYHGTYAIPGSVSTLTYDATASADYGIIEVFGQSSISLTAAGSDGPEYIDTDVWAGFSDQWTISGGTAGTTGTLELSFDITGSYDSNFDANIGYGLGLDNQTKSTEFYDNQLPDYTGILSTEFTFDEEFDFSIIMYGNSTLDHLSMGGYDGQTSYLGMSAIMSAIVVKDSSGNVIPFSLTTASNAALFNQLATTVPIPAAIWLFGSGLLGLAGIARRKKAV